MSPESTKEVNAIENGEVSVAETTQPIAQAQSVPVVNQDEEISDEENPGRALTMTEQFYDKFKVELTKLLGKKLSGKIGRKLAAAVFREAFDHAVQFTIDKEDHKVPIIGIGRFYINFSKPRSFPGKESCFSHLGEIPHFRFKASSRYQNYAIQELCGVDISNIKGASEELASDSE